MLYKVTYFGNAVNYESEQLFMCPMFVTECYHNKCLNCQPCVQFIFSPRSESDMILSVMTQTYFFFNFFCKTSSITKYRTVQFLFQIDTLHDRIDFYTMLLIKVITQQSSIISLSKSIQYRNQYFM